MKNETTQAKHSPTPKLTPDDRAMIASRMASAWFKLVATADVAPAPIDEATHTQAAGCFIVGENVPETGATWAAFRLNREMVEWQDLSRFDRSDILSRCRGIVGMLNCAAALKNGVRSRENAATANL